MRGSADFIDSLNPPKDSEDQIIFCLSAHMAGAAVEKFIPAAVYLFLERFDHPLIFRFKHVLESALLYEPFLDGHIFSGLVIERPYAVLYLKQRPVARLNLKMSG